MEITTEVEDTKAIMTIEGKVTVQTAAQIKAAITALPEEVKDIDVDVAKVTYLSSAGLRTLVLAAKLSKRRHGVMRMLDPSEDIINVLTMTGLKPLLMPED